MFFRMFRGFSPNRIVWGSLLRKKVGSGGWMGGPRQRAWAPIGLPSCFLSGWAAVTGLGSHLHVSFLGWGWVGRGDGVARSAATDWVPLGALHVSPFSSWVRWVGWRFKLPSGFPFGLLGWMGGPRPPFMSPFWAPGSWGSNGLRQRGGRPGWGWASNGLPACPHEARPLSLRFSRKLQRRVLRKKTSPTITTLQSPHSNHHTTVTTLPSPHYNHHTPISTLPSPQYHHITSAIKFSLIS